MDSYLVKAIKRLEKMEAKAQPSDVQYGTALGAAAEAIDTISEIVMETEAEIKKRTAHPSPWRGG